MLELIAGVIIGIGVLGGVGVCMALAAMMKSGSEEY
ncbi:Tfp pilus assembly protein PilV [Curtobacterium pusillum]|uniref:Tfp pilus assembly protein PilV n=1 Tax=Curtobacterium pusillum TaxID=69373 RepID=A0AAW3T6E6_9MICO|nr:Tfp pilus assembly protein PilV [Curtobacterium pusillum]